MKRVHAIVVILVALTLMIPSFSSLVSAQTVWRDGEQFQVVSSNQVVLFNISNVPIPIPMDAKDINVTIHARFRLLRAPDIVNIRAFVCGVSNNVVFTLSSSGSKRIILNAHMKPNKLSNWNVTICPEDICSNVLDVNITLVNVSPIEGFVNITNAYVVLSNFSTPLKALIPASNKVLIIAKYRDANTGKIHNNTTTATSSSQPKPNFLRPGIIMTWILLLILIPTIAFLFSGGDRRERGRVALSSIGGVFVFGIFEIFMSRSWIWTWIWTTFITVVIFLILLSDLDLDLVDNGNLLRVVEISFIITFIILSNVVLLLQNQVRPNDFFLLLWVFFIMFGVGLTFALIWGGGGAVAGIFIYSIIILLPTLGISVNEPIYGFALIALGGYAIVFVQAWLRNNIINDINSSRRLDTFYNLIISAFIVPSALVFAYAFTKGTGLFDITSSASSQIEIIRNEFLYLSLLYLGLTLTSILLLWADDVLRQARFQPPRLTLQNAIAMLLIMLGIGSVSILELNHHPWWAVEVFSGEAVFGIILLVLFSRRN